VTPNGLSVGIVANHAAHGEISVRQSMRAGVCVDGIVVMVDD
jgi:hypothetical protein